ncbi:hypothetical protein JKG68_30815 [Microvirga aerilata]|uniref:Uncharacterized protein n=1 Tax=Microvirga aerilata TaxID=670292 RepID=A0A936ZLI5_9HYPH|nr:hypothetical protein [Microvirga aerilata]MBL0408275.1 hypothetical protein [Microvirga aerilata]
MPDKVRLHRLARPKDSGRLAASPPRYRIFCHLAQALPRILSGLLHGTRFTDGPQVVDLVSAPKVNRANVPGSPAFAHLIGRALTQTAYSGRPSYVAEPVPDWVMLLTLFN